MLFVFEVSSKIKFNELNTNSISSLFFDNLFSSKLELSIFVSSFANEKQKSELLIIANNLKVELIEMVWKHDSFETRDYKKSIEFINKINI